jgi:hypothetical protein
MHLTMPHHSKSLGPPPGSPNIPQTFFSYPSHSPHGPGFTESKQSRPEPPAAKPPELNTSRAEKDRAEEFEPGKPESEKLLPSEPSSGKESPPNRPPSDGTSSEEYEPTKSCSTSRSPAGNIPAGQKPINQDRASPGPEKGSGGTVAGASPTDSPLNVTERFPEGLYRIPIPDRVFSEMSGLSDSALRGLFGLISLSWEFRPGDSQSDRSRSEGPVPEVQTSGGGWVSTGRWLNRAQVQEVSGLSAEGTRQGLSELREVGWAEVSRSGKAHLHRITLEVPAQRYTYLPVALLQQTGRLPSGAALRALLVVFRSTWGWAHVEDETDQRGAQAVHQRWTRLSVEDIAARSGRSKTAIRGAACALREMGLVSRARPTSGEAPCYRICPEMLEQFLGEQYLEEERSEEQTRGEEIRGEEIRGEGIQGERIQEDSGSGKNSGGDGSKGGCKETTSCGETTEATERIANKLRGDRQQTEEARSPKGSYIESSLEDSQNKSQSSKPIAPGQETSSDQSPRGAVRNSSSTDGGQLGGRQPEAGRSQEPTSSGKRLSPEKRDLLKKLVNAGVWPWRARECLQKYSAGRVRANFQLWRGRKNGSETPQIEDDGAFLCAAITDGFAGFSAGQCSSAGQNTEQNTESDRDSSWRGPSRRGRSGRFQEAGRRRTNYKQAGGGPPEDERPRDSQLKQGQLKQGQPENTRPGHAQLEPQLDHKQKVSAAEKRRLVRRSGGPAADDFYRYRQAESPEAKQYLYLDPAIGPRERGPASRQPASGRSMSGEPGRH